MNIPTDLIYSKEHMWVRREGVDMRIGVTDFAQDDMGKVMFIELPKLGDELTRNEPFASVESDKSVSELYAPISGTVVEVNEGLTDDPEEVNESPYDGAWMVVVEPADDAELDDLLSAEDYEEHISK
ncbi:MAG TPA: glycine cleavage system protein GcvH [Pseudogracilibacillus sp.]|nr:glycine cleavage system protein GcvH [Pseudogracilibacillus sp.]